MPTRAPLSAATIEPVERATMVELVVDSIRSKILLGQLPVGSRLPAERELAQSFGVNRLTLRAALSRLQALGLIVVRHGTGTIIANWRETAGIETLSFLLRTGDPSDPSWRTYLDHLLEIRRIIAAETVALACDRRTKADLAELRRVIELARAKLDDPVAFAEADVAIARAVVRISRNLGFELLLNMLAPFPDLQPEVARAMYPDPASHMNHHDAVLALLEQGDAELARKFLRSALEQQDRATLAQLSAASRTPRKSVAARRPLKSKRPTRARP